MDNIVINLAAIRDFIINNIFYVVMSLLIAGLIANNKKLDQRIAYMIIAVPVVFFILTRLVDMWSNGRYLDILSIVAGGALVAIAVKGK
jgi:hypothetical protein